MLRSKMEKMANTYDADLLKMMRRAEHMANGVVPCNAHERDDWLKVHAYLREARYLIQRTRYRDDRADLRKSA